MKLFIAGKTCSGKSYVARKLAECYSLPLWSFGSAIRRISQSLDASYDVQSLQDLGQRLINEKGYAGFLEYLIKFESQVEWSSSLIIDGVRHVEMYRALQKRFPCSCLVYCECSQSVQVSRMIARDHISLAQAQKIISHPIECNTDMVESSANYVHHSEDDILELISALRGYVT